MSEQELNSILEEIKNRGKTNSSLNGSSEEINFDFNAASSRRSRRERLEQEEEGDSPTQKTEQILEEETDSVVKNDNVAIDESDSIEIEDTVELKVDSPVKADEEEIVFSITDEDVQNEEEQSSDETEETENEVETDNIEFDDDETSQNNESDDEEINIQAEYREIEVDEGDEPKKSNSVALKKRLIISASIILAVAIITAVACLVVPKLGKVEIPNMKEPATESSSQVPQTVVDNTPKNPLTGESGYNENAIGKRPVAVVVENEYSTESVRPQWGLADADVVMEAESEYSTRLLLFWADYNTVPSQVGPARSARPPFIRFSELFDAVFIHAGLSRSKGDYIGADSVFESDNVDHINLLHCPIDYFNRDKSRTSTIEHTGFFVGTNAEKMLNAYSIKTDFTPENYTQFKFNDEAVDLSTTAAKNIEFKWSGTNGGRCPKLGKFTYNEETKKYTTTDFDSSYGKADVEWENLVFLLDQTAYIEKHNYKGSHTEVYCNYLLSGGKGLIVSNGTAVEITWNANNGKLSFMDANGKEVKLNKGKTYIGYGSENRGGYFKINDDQTSVDAE